MIADAIADIERRRAEIEAAALESRPTWKRLLALSDHLLEQCELANYRDQGRMRKNVLEPLYLLESTVFGEISRCVKPQNCVDLLFAIQNAILTRLRGPLDDVSDALQPAKGIRPDDPGGFDSESGTL